MVAPPEKQSPVLEWVGRLPGFLDEIRSSRVFAAVWEMLQNDFAARRPGYECVLGKAAEKLRVRLGIDPAGLPAVTAVVNRLGARECVDFAVVDGTTYTVSADPDAGDILHELLHHLLGARLKAVRGVVQGYFRLLGPTLERMLALQYAWDDGAESWDRVFEENIMRAVSLWVSHGDGAAADRQAARFAGDGFIYVPILLSRLRIGWRGLGGFEEFIRDGLEACEACRPMDADGIE